MKTDKFLWKVSPGLTGGREVQISESEQDLGELVREISASAQAMDSLARFLDRLDKIGLQRELLARAAAKASKTT